MGDSNISELLSSIKEAGSTLMALRPIGESSYSNLQVRPKDDGTLVSKADTASNNILLKAISKLFPHDVILSEESPCDVQALKSSSRTWVIDPLDGTASFVSGRDDFSILVALVEDHQPTVGLMFFPARNLMVVAERGKGVVCNGLPLHVSTEPAPRVGSVYIRNFDSRRPELASPMMDSGLALLKVATGELDGAIIRMTTHREWDIAAPIVAIMEAGGKVSDETGAPVVCGTGQLTYKYLVASNAKIHQALRAIIP